MASVDHGGPGEARRRRRRTTFSRALAAALVLLSTIWIVPFVIAFLSDLDLDGMPRPYLTIFLFVVFDAIVPVLPSESLLTTASNLAAQSDSSIVLWRVALAGWFGAVIGDSMLYWLARTVLRRSMSDVVERSEENPKIARPLRVLSGTAPLVIVFGRFVPGLRFVVGATMGLSRFPYPRFLLWDIIGAGFWSWYTCIFSYLVATVIADMPVVSIAVSVVVTTALLALLFKPLQASWKEAGEPVPGPAQ